MGYSNGYSEQEFGKVSLNIKREIWDKYTKLQGTGIYMEIKTLKNFNRKATFINTMNRTDYWDSVSICFFPKEPSSPDSYRYVLRSDEKQKLRGFYGQFREKNKCSILVAYSF